MTVCLVESSILSTLNNWKIRVQKALSTSSHKLKDLILRAVMKIIKKETTHAPRLPTVLDEKIVVAPLLEAGVVIEIEIITDPFEGLMKMSGIFVK